MDKEGLDAKMGLECEGLSVGRLQAICLVREIVTKKRVVILDEVTSNFDHDSEKRFKDVFFREFAGSTILIISHRLDTVLHCDKVLVLDYGEMIEFDSPQELLKNPKSSFYALAHHSKM